MGRTATGCFPLGPVWICELGSDAEMGLSQTDPTKLLAVRSDRVPSSVYLNLDLSD